MADCCAVRPGATTEATKGLVCQQCGRPGKPIDRITVDALLKPELRAGLNGMRYVFCETPDCPVVYFALDGTRFTKDQIRVRVGLKETEDPILVCYCFGITERMIREEMERTGRSTASARIRSEVKAGTCRCEVENPSGRCCLGEVSRVEKRGVGLRNESGGAAPTITTTGSLLAAFLASLCCVGPLVLTALGVGVGATGFLASTAGALKALLPYRPFFIGLTALLLGAGFYLTYRTPKSGCGSGATCAPTSGQRRSRLLLWVASGLALVLILAPYWLGL
jgi:mercuric ion transport protein